MTDDFSEEKVEIRGNSLLRLDFIVPYTFDAKKYQNTLTATLDPFNREASITLNVGEPSLFAKHIPTILFLAATGAFAVGFIYFMKKKINGKID